MLYKIAHYLRDHFPFLWDWIEGVNSILFKYRYRKGIRQIPTILESYSMVLSDGIEEKHLSLRLIKQNDCDKLATFFKSQPEVSFTFFRPHAFDIDTLKALSGRDSFITMIALVDNEIVGYFFLRAFFHGKCFLGKMVGIGWQGKGIGKVMCRAAMNVATSLGMRMFESINKNNPASLGSSSVLRQVVVKELENDDVLIEDFPL